MKKVYKHSCWHEWKPIKHQISLHKLCPVCGMYLFKGKQQTISLNI